ncbi:HDOD domain-containing protein [Kolteria novifilia]
MQQLAADVALDPRATADVLRLVNSAAFGMSREILNVAEGVKLLGTKRTICTVISACMAQFQQMLKSRTGGKEVNWSNRRGVLIASATATFADRMSDVCPDAAYALGLLQDFGILALMRVEGSRYIRLLNRFRASKTSRLEVLEKEEFDLNHADIGAALLQHWGLPETMVGLVMRHHDPLPEETITVEQKFLHLMNIGEALANWRDHSVPERYERFRQSLGSAAAVPVEDIKDCIAEIAHRAEEANRLFRIPQPDPQELSELAHGLATKITEGAEGRPAVETETPSFSLNDVRQRVQILVVDDDSSTIALTKHFLGKAGMEARPCSTAREALQLAPECHAALVDVHLSDGASGVDIAKELRQGGFTRPLIMISADRRRSTVVACAVAGANDYVTKPFTFDTLVPKVSSLVSAHLGHPARS